MDRKEIAACCCSQLRPLMLRNVLKYESMKYNLDTVLLQYYQGNVGQHIKKEKMMCNLDSSWLREKKG